MSLERLLDRARAQRAQVLPHLETVAELCMPQRTVLYGGEGVGTIRASYASFPAVAAAEFVARLVTAVMPAYRRWAEFEATDPDLDPAVAEDATLALEMLLRTLPLREAVAEVFWDAGLGLGLLWIGTDSRGALLAEPVPPASILVANEGETTVLVGREMELETWEARRRFPDLRLDGNPRSVRLSEVVELDDPDGPVWIWRVLDHRGRTLRERRLEGAGASPFVLWRWHRVPGTGWGVGPLYLAARDFRTLADMRQYVLTSLAFNALRPVSYEQPMMGDDQAVRLEPGMWVRRDPQTEPPTPLEVSGPPSLGMAEEQNVEERIKRTLYLDQLGPITGTPKSATEILQRQAELARVIGAPYGRLSESLVEAITRTARLAARTGRLAAGSVAGPALERLLASGRLRVVASGPFARQQRMAEVETAQQFLAFVGQVLGPAGVAAVVDLPAMLREIASDLGFPASLVRDEKEIAQAIAAVVQAQQGGGA